MQHAMFMQPSHPPERDVREGIEQDLTIIEWCDQLGFSEVWIGEHLSASWEPYPAHDLILAQAIPRTERITLCSGGYVLPFYHPAALALRIAQLDHMAQGRYICGIAAGAIPTDFALLDIDLADGANRRMMRESLEIMIKIWTDPDPWRYEGEFWTVNNPEPFMTFGPHLRPFQAPYPRIGLAGMSPRSETIRFAGEQGCIPLSISFNLPHLADHWTMVEEGAQSAGISCDRADWHVIREVFVAETDREAKDWVRSSPFGDMWRAMHLPTIRELGWEPHFKHDDAVPDDAVDLDYFIDHLFMVGSVETVTEKILAADEALGGFGTLVMTKYDFGSTPGPYRDSLALLANEVMPAVNRRLGAAHPAGTSPA
jgi:alkanesulfonate monooxygenase SsuD/methylene tetrahydromethanopterin reductase-like flavin-dependent oxidoreductase (luciferase family)